MFEARSHRFVTQFSCGVRKPSHGAAFVYGLISWPVAPISFDSHPMEILSFFHLSFPLSETVFGLSNPANSGHVPRSTFEG